MTLTNEKLLKGMNKKISVAQAEQVLKWCGELDIKTKVFFVFGHIGQTFQDCLDDIKWLRKNRNNIDFFANTMGMKLYPGTILEKQAAKLGLIPADLSWANYKPSIKNLLLLELGDTITIDQKQLSILKLLFVGILLNFYRVNLNPRQSFKYIIKVIQSTINNILK